MTELNTLKYELAPPGSPDKYRLTENAVFNWVGVPKGLYNLVKRGVKVRDGYIQPYLDKQGRRCLCAVVNAGFYFAVSVAPSFRRALGAACLHDFIYANVEHFAIGWDCLMREVLHLADHWFLANMRAAGFFLKRSYFIGVRTFGYAFNRFLGGFKK